MIVDYTLVTNNMGFNAFHLVFFWGQNVILFPKGLEKFFFVNNFFFEVEFQSFFEFFCSIAILTKISKPKK